MKPFFPLLLVICACAHTSMPQKGDRCSVVTSARDLSRVRLDHRRTYLEVKEATQKLSRVLEVVKTVSLNDRNTAPKPLSVEQTVQVRQKLEGLQDVLAGEAEHLDALANEVPEVPVETMPDGIATEPMLSELQRVCVEDEARKAAELASTRAIVDHVMIEFRQVVADNQLPVRMEKI